MYKRNKKLCHNRHMKLSVVKHMAIGAHPIGSYSDAPLSTPQLNPPPP